MTLPNPSFYEGLPTVSMLRHDRRLSADTTDRQAQWLLALKAELLPTTQTLFKLKRKSLVPTSDCRGTCPNYVALQFLFLKKKCTNPTFWLSHLSQQERLVKFRAAEVKNQGHCIQGPSWIVDSVCEGLGVSSCFGGCLACVLGFKVRMVPLTWQQLCQGLGAFCSNTHPCCSL